MRFQTCGDVTAHVDYARSGGVSGFQKEFVRKRSCGALEQPHVPLSYSTDELHLYATRQIVAKKKTVKTEKVPRHLTPASLNKLLKEWVKKNPQEV